MVRGMHLADAVQVLFPNPSAKGLEESFKRALKKKVSCSETERKGILRINNWQKKK